MRGLGRKTQRCGKHGYKYFVFKGVGPCMHPECAKARLMLWAETVPSSKAAFRPIMHRLDDFLVWGMTDGAVKLGYEWDSRVAWEEAVSSYMRSLRIEQAAQAVAVETDRLMYLANNRGAVMPGATESNSVNPDHLLFTKECIGYLSKAFSAPMAAYVLDVIDLQDLAKLCYEGDVFAAQDDTERALASLKEWFHATKKSAQYLEDYSEQRLQSA